MQLQATTDIDSIQMGRRVYEHVYEHAEETNFEKKIKYIDKTNIFLKNIRLITTYGITLNIEDNKSYDCDKSTS